MIQFNKTFTIQWVGPFKSYKKLKEYFKDTSSLDSGLFNLYIYESAKDGRYNSNKYIGIHKKNDGIDKRLNGCHEHLGNHLDDKNFKLWIGSFGNRRDQNNNNIELVETLLIQAYKDNLDENSKKKKSLPSVSVAINNLWYDTKENLMKYSKQRPSFVDDMLLYEAETRNFYHGKMKRL